MTTKLGLYIEELNDKQYNQLLSLCEEFQPYGNFENVVFLEVVFAARIFCDRSCYPFRGNNKNDRFNNFLIDELMCGIKSKFYFNGLKYANRTLTGKQYRTILNVSNTPKIRIPDFGNIYLKHNPVEKELFMKVVRACRDYMRAKMNKEAQQELFERLCVVYDAMAN